VPDEDQTDRRWIVEPPGRGKVTLHLSVGEDTELTEEQEAALAELLRSLEAADPEVSGFAAGGACGGYLRPCVMLCNDLICPSVRCGLVCDGLATKSTAVGGGQAWSLGGSFGRP
jgi:hypothetical protein